MPKVRKNISDFIDSADNVEKLNPNAKRDYKKITVPFNQYEYELLDKLATKHGRTKLNFIRWAISEIDKK